MPIATVRSTQRHWGMHTQRRECETSADTGVGEKVSLRVIYNGPPRGVPQLAQTLKDEGLVVLDQPTVEQWAFGVEQEWVTVSLDLGDEILNSTEGLSVDILVQTTVARFKDRHADIPIEILVERAEQGRI
jgi:hypothetical protein